MLFITLSHINTQGDCIIGNMDSSIDIGYCQSRSSESGTKCCLMSYEMQGNNLTMCYPFPKNANNTILQSMISQSHDKAIVECNVELISLKLFLYFVFFIILS